MPLCGGEATAEEVDGAVFEEGLHEGEEYPGGGLWVCPVPVVHVLVVYDHVAIPLATVHNLVPLSLTIVGGDPLTESRDVVQPTIRFLGAFEDEGGDGVYVNAML